MYTVHPKKSLGQHFLKDENIARKIVDSLEYTGNVLEIGPGTGVLTKYLVDRSENLKLIEIDDEAIAYLNTLFPSLSKNIIHGDFLKHDTSAIYSSQFAVIGNFPYNISSQIFFKIIGQRQHIPEVVGMITKRKWPKDSVPPPVTKPTEYCRCCWVLFMRSNTCLRSARRCSCRRQKSNLL